jgi:basic membrane protein A and related proteins
VTGKRALTATLAASLTALALVLGATGGSAAPTQTVKMAVVTDIGGLQDRSFNQDANSGRIRAQRVLKIQTTVYDTKTAADRIPNLQAAARAGHTLVIGNGFFHTDPLNRVAPAFPDIKFAGIDVSYSELESKPPNVRGIQFREQEAGYLVGYIAGLVVRQQSGPDVVSAVGANKVPAIVRYLAGFRAGAKKANARVRYFEDYANDPTFADQAKCKETTENQIERGTKIVFVVAGGCGLGAHAALRAESGLWGIGVDVDQAFLGRHILTSALKSVANAVFLTTQEFKRNPSRFRTGFNKVFTVKNGGHNYGKISTRVPGRAAIIKKVEAIKKQIASGKIKPPAK